MTGDVLVVRRGVEAQPHYGIDWGWGQVAHVQAGGRAEVVPFEVFSRGFPVFIARPADPDEVPAILARAESLLGRPYNVVTFNCESFVSFAVTGQLRSWTLEQFVALGAVVVLGVVAVRALQAA